jgi:hypothetical protein
MKDINFKPVEKELERLIKKKIKDEGLVKTGKLLNSISVSYKSGTFQVTAEDYYEYLDEEYQISESVVNSNEFISFFESHLAKQIEKNI